MTNRIKVPIEIPYGISIFALIFAESVTTNWMMYRTCYTTLGYNETDCALLGSGDASNSTTDLEKIVQPYVTVIALVKSITQLLAAFVCFFLGPWSDKYGRKPVMLLSFSSFGFSFGIMAVISAIPNLSPWYVLLCSLPTGITGGFIAQLTVILCYITDTTTSTGRGIRMSIIEAASTGGSLIGTLSSSYIFNLYGYTVMFVIATSCYVICTLIIFFFVPESVTVTERKDMFHNFFQLSLLKKSFSATVKKRRNYDRAVLITAMLVLLTYVLAFSEFNFTFLYLRKTLKWSLRQFTIFSGGTTITGIIGSVLVVYILHTLFKVHESIMVLLGLLSAFSSALVVALATNNWYIYASGALKFLAGIISPMARTLVSKVALEDSGAVFGFLAVCETLMTLIGRLVYTYIYNELYPAALYFFTAGVIFFVILLNIGLICLQKQKSTVSEYRIMENEIN